MQINGEISACRLGMFKIVICKRTMKEIVFRLYVKKTEDFLLELEILNSTISIIIMRVIVIITTILIVDKFIENLPCESR